MSQVWTQDYLSGLAVNAEIEISYATPCIYYRLALDIIAGTTIYDIGDIFTGIIRVTFNGFTVHPVFQRELRNNVIPLQPSEGEVQSSRPFMYMRTGYNDTQLKLYPAPNASITAYQTNIYNQTGIASQCIVAGWRVADPGCANYMLPPTFRRYIIKAYVLSHAFLKEGPGFNQQASDFWTSEYNMLLREFKKFTQKVYGSFNRSMGDMFINTYGRRPPHPRLPSNFGTPV